MREDTRTRSFGAGLRSVAAMLVALALVASGCSSPSSGEPTGITVVATTTIWADVAAQIVGDDGSVVSLMPVGADPHGFQASSSQVAAMVSADLVVANGLGLEVGLTDVLETAQLDGANVLWVGVAAQPVGSVSGSRTCLPLLASAGIDQPTGCDPHVWMDPERAALAAVAIADALVQMDDSVDWRARASDYAQELATAAQTIESMLLPIPDARRKLVTNHDSLGYFAARFDLEIIETVIPTGSTLADPSSGDLADLVERMIEEDVKVIFAETTDPTGLAEAVASEVGANVSVVELYTGSIGAPGSGADSLIGMLTLNAELIADALAG